VLSVAAFLGPGTYVGRGRIILVIVVVLIIVFLIVLKSKRDGTFVS
jgi:hypothetical protein